MTTPSRPALETLRILVVEDEESVAAAVCAALRRRGHEVSLASSRAEALALPAHDVLVCDLCLGTDSGFELVSALRERGESPRVVFLSGLPRLDDCRRAMRLGAADFLPKPFALDDLLDAVERAGTQRPEQPGHDGSSEPASRTPAPASTEPPTTFHRAYRQAPESVERGARDVAAFALQAGIGPASRTRVASACAEILDNAVRHSSAAAHSQIEIEAELEAAGGPSELVVRVRDAGRGFDAVAGWVESAPSLLPDVDAPELASNGHAGPAARRAPTETRGLVRAASLSEDLRVASDGRGTEVMLRFTCAPGAFDEEGVDGVRDLSELEYLAGDMARVVLQAIEAGEDAASELVNISPALAVTVGRLLSGRTSSQIALTALWS